MAGQTWIAFFRAIGGKTHEKMPMAALEGWMGPERCRASGREVHLDFPDGIGRSKLTPVILERLIGAPGTARNWNTLTRIVKASA